MLWLLKLKVMHKIMSKTPALFLHTCEHIVLHAHSLSLSPSPTPSTRNFSLLLNLHQPGTLNTMQQPSTFTSRLARKLQANQRSEFKNLKSELFWLLDNNSCIIIIIYLYGAHIVWTVYISVYVYTCLCTCVTLYVKQKFCGKGSLNLMRFK